MARIVISYYDTGGKPLASIERQTATIKEASNLASYLAEYLDLLLKIAEDDNETI